MCKIPRLCTTVHHNWRAIIIKWSLSAFKERRAKKKKEKERHSSFSCCCFSAFCLHFKGSWSQIYIYTFHQFLINHGRLIHHFSKLFLQTLVSPCWNEPMLWLHHVNWSFSWGGSLFCFFLSINNSIEQHPLTLTFENSEQEQSWKYAVQCKRL